MTDDIAAIQKALAEPFEAHEVKFKPAVVQGNRALALHYVDARAIMDRLDSVLGIGNWKDEYQSDSEGSISCRLSLRIGGEWIAKMDVGGESEQPDEGDQRKAGYSDALKRAAVKWGIGRYLYRIPSGWFSYDPQKKKFAETPRLPAGAQPRQSAGKPAPPAPPATGEELEKRLAAFESKLVEKGLCSAGELLRHIDKQGVRANFPDAIRDWKEIALTKGMEWAKEFESGRKQAKAPAQPSANGQAPVQAPAQGLPPPNTGGEPDGAIGQPEEREIQKLLRDANMLWPKARKWLNDNLGSSFGEQHGILDMNHGHYQQLRLSLQQYIARKQKEAAGAKP